MGNIYFAYGIRWQRDEAFALVNTWKKSYFQTPGLRFLYLVPRIETDRIIPLKITPAPEKLVRSLVGRVEVMTKFEEENMLNLIENSQVFNAKNQLGRFFEPKLHRLLDLASKIGEQRGSLLKNKITKLLEKIYL
jgi:hypothetical protein